MVWKKQKQRPWELLFPSSFQHFIPAKKQEKHEDDTFQFTLTPAARAVEAGVLSQGRFGEAELGLVPLELPTTAVGKILPGSL